MLVKPMPTRWNTKLNSYQCLHDQIFEKRDDRLVEKREKVDKMMDELGLITFSQDDVDFLKDWCNVFEPFARALNVLQSDTHAYVGALLPILSKTKEMLKEKAQNSLFCKPLVEKLILG